MVGGGSDLSYFGGFEKVKVEFDWGNGRRDEIVGGDKVIVELMALCYNGLVVFFCDTNGVMGCYKVV